jgi:hypothetical protein
MNKKELVEIIRTVVREEINNSLPQYLMEVLAERITAQPVISESNDESKVNNTMLPRKKPNVSFDAPIKQQPVQAPKTFSSNPILNQVLNETVGGIPDENSVAAPSAIDTLKSLPREVLAENKEVAAVANAMTRDYSKLLKAIDQKAKSSRP